MSSFNMSGRTSASVLAYAQSIGPLSEGEVGRQFSDTPAKGEPWFGYVEDPRNLTLFLNLQLNRLTSEIRSTVGTSRATEICTQHHRAYRDMTGSLAGISPAEFDAVPREGEWPLRKVIWHITGAELGFLLLIDWAINRAAGNTDLPIMMPAEDMAPHYEAYPESGAMEEVLSRYDELHRRAISRLSNLSPDELNARNVWWEGYEVPVWFRMQRFDAHLREHTIQVDKTRQDLGRAPTEGERLARLLHQSLGEFEIAFALADSSWASREAELADAFDNGVRRLEGN